MSIRLTLTAALLGAGLALCATAPARGAATATSTTSTAAPAPTASASPTQAATSTAGRPEFTTVTEMGRIAEESEGTWCRPGEFPAETATVRGLWAKEAPWLKEKVTPELARSLSRWAKTQMEGYNTVSPIEKAAIEPIHKNAAGKPVVFEVMLDTLPSHSPLVKRWLKAYLVFDPAAGKITRIIVTVRGQVEE
jgi:hypothetical protein